MRKRKLKCSNRSKLVEDLDTLTGLPSRDHLEAKLFQTFNEQIVEIKSSPQKRQRVLNYLV